MVVWKYANYTNYMQKVHTFTFTGWLLYSISKDKEEPEAAELEFVNTLDKGITKV